MKAAKQLLLSIQQKASNEEAAANPSPGLIEKHTSISTTDGGDKKSNGKPGEKRINKNLGKTAAFKAITRGEVDSIKGPRPAYEK